MLNNKIQELLAREIINLIKSGKYKTTQEFINKNNSYQLFLENNNPQGIFRYPEYRLKISDNDYQIVLKHIQEMINKGYERINREDNESVSIAKNNEETSAIYVNESIQDKKEIEKEIKQTLKNSNNETSAVQPIDNTSSNYDTADNMNSKSEELSNSNSMQGPTNAKVKTLSNNHNISTAFTNTLILSFIIGSFFGIVFLAIYTKIMH